MRISRSSEAKEIFPTLRNKLSPKLYEVGYLRLGFRYLIHSWPGPIKAKRPGSGPKSVKEIEKRKEKMSRTE